MKKFYATFSQWRAVFLACISILIFTPDARASHAMGADIEYHYVGVNGAGQQIYEVQLTFYRNCDGIQQPTAAGITADFDITNTCGYPVPAHNFVQVTNDSCPENTTFYPTGNPPLSGSNGCVVTQLCPSFQSQSTCASPPGSFPGVQRFVYRCQIVLGGPCSQWKLSFAENARNTNINNVSGGGVASLYLDAVINNNFDTTSAKIVIPNLRGTDYQNLYVKTAAGCTVPVATSLTVPTTGATTPTITSSGSPICVNGAPRTLTATPAGGTWTIDGAASGGTLNPGTLSIGFHKVVYTYVNGTCATSASQTIEVRNTIPVQIFLPTHSICSNAASIQLGANPLGGVFLANGDTLPNGLFNPALQNFGNRNIFYKYSDGVCTSSTTVNASYSGDTIHVYDAPLITGSSFTPPSACGVRDGVITLTGLPASSTFQLQFDSNNITIIRNVTSNASGQIVLNNRAASLYNNFTLTSAGGCSIRSNISIPMSNAAIPFFTVSNSANPSSCSVMNGTITLSGLASSTFYGVAFDSCGVMATRTLTSSASGDIVLNGLPSCRYKGFAVGTLAGCVRVLDTVVQLADVLTNSFDINSSNSPLCVSALPRTLSATINGGTWMIDTVADPSGTFNPAALTVGLHKITYTVVSGGCTLIDTQYVSVVPAPSVAIYVPTQTCGGDTVHLGANPGGGVFSGPGVSGNNFFLPDTAPAGSRLIVYNFISPFGCTSSANQSIVVNAAPVVNTIVGTNPSTCGTGSGSITLTGLTAGMTYRVTYDSMGYTRSRVINASGSGALTLSTLKAGIYTNFKIENMTSGCSVKRTDIITLKDNNSPNISSVATATSTNCSSATGSITLTGNFSGGTAYTVCYDSLGISVCRSIVATSQQYRNNSVVFGNDPVPFFCSNTPATFNNSISDVDRDSLVSTMVTPMDDGGIPLTYNGGFSLGSPITTSTGTQFNSATGQLSFTPTATSPEGDVLAFRFNEYRNGVLVGYTMRDVQIVILQCNQTTPVNSPPTNLNGATALDSATVQLCPGSTSSFDIVVRDPNGHNILLKSNLTGNNSPLPGAIFQSVFQGAAPNDTAIARITWTPQLADTGCHYFTLTAQTDDCPVMGSLTKVYQVCVVNRVTVSPHTSIFCGTPIKLTASGGTTSQWSPPAGLSSTTSPVTYASPSVTTRYTFTSSCGSDTALVIYNPPFTMDAGSDVSICQNGQIQMNATVDNLYAPYSIKWTPAVQNGYSTLIDPVTAYPSDFILNPVAQPLFTTRYTVTFTANTGCVRTDSVLVTVNGVAPKLVPSANPTQICPGTTTRLLVLSSPTTCGLTVSPCTGTQQSAQVGSSTTQEGGTSAMYPSPYGANRKSARHQYLIRKNELLAVTGSGGSLTSLAMEVGALNSNTGLNNFTVRLGCTQQDSLTGFIETGLAQVKNPFLLTPANAWGTVITFDNPYNWDGSSNLVVDICFSNTSNGSGNNKMKITTLPYKATWWTASNVGSQCGITGSQSGVLTLPNWAYTRPNMRFNICQDKLIDSMVTWSPGTGPNAANPVHNDTSAATPIATTTYKVSYSTLAGCQSQGFVTVTVVDSATVKLSPKDTFMCSLDSVQLHATLTGGVNPNSVIYQWSVVGAGTAPPSGTGTAFAHPKVKPSVTTKYVVAVDLGSCITRDTTTITIGTSLPVDATIIDSIKCNGQCNAKIKAIPAGGIPPLVYVWNVAGSTDSLVNQCPGTYIVQVTDHQGCSGRDTVIVPQPSALALTLDSVNVNCFGQSTGSVTATVSGGTPSYTYTWNPSQGGNPSQLTNLGTGIYQLTVTDRNGCSLTAQRNVSQPAAPLSTVKVTRNISGAGLTDGMARVIPSGGTAPYNYAWSTGPSIDSINNLGAGTYYVTVCDAKGCCKIDTLIITIPPPINIVFTKRDVNCFGGNDGFASFTASGGVLPYTYSWSNSLGTNDSILNVLAGTYTVTVQDSNGITVSNSVTIGQPDSIHTVLTPTNISCFGAADGSISAVASGGTPGYTYSWQPGGSSSNPLTNLAPNTYTVEVTDAHGCKDTASVAITQPTKVTVSLVKTDSVKCFGQSDGKATVHPSGGTPPYSYNWSPTTVNDSVLTGIAAGIYHMTVTDSKGCFDTLSFTIYEPAQISATVTPTNANCATSNDGSAVATASNGTLPYTFTWDGTAGSANATGLSAGSHTLVVTDANGCTVSKSFNIDTNYVLHLSIVTDSTSCFNGNDGKATVTALNGAAGYSYNWNPANANAASVTGLNSGTVSVVVTDAHNCTASISGNVEQPADITLVTTGIDPNCHDQPQGKAFVTASGGSGGYVYAWDNNPPSATDTAFNLIAGTYHVSVSDSKGCQKTSSVTLNNPPAVGATSEVQEISCFNTNDGKITVHPAGGTPPYTFGWTPPGTDSIQQNLTGGSYVVVITDSKGCDTTLNFTLNTPTPISITAAKADSVSCPKSADGAISMLVSGGTPGALGYEYSINSGNWQPTGNFANLGAGTYDVKARDSKGCSIDTMLTVGKPQELVLSILPQDTTIKMGNSLQLTTLTSGYPLSGIRSFSWLPSGGLSCADCPDPIASPYHKQTYTLIAFYGADCSDTTKVTIDVENNLPIYIPNAFSPNGDGNNDVFQIYGEGIKTVSMRIFNRWGEKIFDSANQWVGWDGMYRGVQQPPMVYTFTIQIEYLDGKKIQKDGSVTLVR
ncbi:MAG: gliding motility-associated C-terminal domain-containing protein [Chitinophagales bacterium]